MIVRPNNIEGEKKKRKKKKKYIFLFSFSETLVLAFPTSSFRLAE